MYMCLCVLPNRGLRFVPKLCVYLGGVSVWASGWRHADVSFSFFVELVHYTCSLHVVLNAEAHADKNVHTSSYKLAHCKC